MNRHVAMCLHPRRGRFFRIIARTHLVVNEPTRCHVSARVEVGAVAEGGVGVRLEDPTEVDVRAGDVGVREATAFFSRPVTAKLLQLWATLQRENRRETRVSQPHARS